jgi:hypothetical protein
MMDLTCFGGRCCDVLNNDGIFLWFLKCFPKQPLLAAGFAYFSMIVDILLFVHFFCTVVNLDFGLPINKKHHGEVNSAMISCRMKT